MYYVCFLWNLHTIHLYTYVHTRGQQESYYSDDFIAKDSAVDNHLETLGYSSGTVSMTHNMHASFMFVHMYIRNRLMTMACVVQPGGKLLKQLPRAWLILMKQALS